MCTLNVQKIREDFPVLQSREMIYFDNACMTLRPKAVIDAIRWYYEKNCACAGRSLHGLSQELIEALVSAREFIKKFFNADDSYELIFTKNTTEAINMVAKGFPFNVGDEIIISDREHNSNLVPWLALREKGVKCKAVPSDENFEFDMEKFCSMFSARTRMVSVVHISNIDGYKMPVEEIIKIAHDNNASVLIDAAQSAGHIKLDIKKLNPDFITLSAHKACGPVIGCLIAKKEKLSELKPLLHGGGAVEDTTINSYKLARSPERFEAGLQDYAGILGFKEACKYLKSVGMTNIEKHEKTLHMKLSKLLENIPEVRFVGIKDCRKCIGITSFVVDGLHASDIAMMLDEMRNIAVRAGKHCAHAWFAKHKQPASVRASLYLYNSPDEIKIFAEEVEKIAKLMK
jgi:cysteine desulfurase/selenocysteine lyase